MLPQGTEAVRHLRECSVEVPDGGIVPEPNGLAGAHVVPLLGTAPGAVERREVGMRLSGQPVKPAHGSTLGPVRLTRGAYDTYACFDAR